jgi:hypothetical protein
MTDLKQRLVAVLTERGRAVLDALLKSPPAGCCFHRDRYAP